MKRTIAWVITLLLVLTMLPAYNSAKAEAITPLSIAINTKVTKRVYAVGEALNLTGLILDYYNGLVQTPTTVPMTSYVVSDPVAGKFMTSLINGYVFKATDVGEKTITITYNSGVTEDSVVQKPTTTFTVTVVDADVSYPTGFTILTEPANTTYSEGESLNTTGLSLRTTYLNGSTPDLALTDVVITPASDYLLTTADSGTDKAVITWSVIYPSQTLVFTQAFDLTVNEAATSLTIAPLSQTHTFTYAQIGTTFDVGAALTIAPLGADVSWGSSNPAVASVDQDGVVTAVSPGSVVITVTGRGFNMDASPITYTSAQAISAIIVEDNEVEATHIDLNKTAATIGVGSTDELTPSFTPTDTTLRKVKYTSSAPAVATVGEFTGVITGVAAGTTTITAQALDAADVAIAGVTATCSVTVIDIPVDSIVVSQSTASLFAGTALTLNANVMPLNASNPTVTWSSSNSALATVVDGQVTTYDLPATVYPTTVNITATAGSQSATCTITLKDPTMLTQLYLNKTTAAINVNDTLTLTATTAPSTATNKTLKWTSSNPSVATVDQTGKVTALTAGYTLIKAASTDGSGLSASCNVSVSTVNVLIVTLNKSSLTLVEGNTETLTASIYPTNATIPTLKWTSSNTSVATVDSTGKITAKSLSGYAIITAASTDGSGKYAECYVVTQARVTVTGITINYGTALDILKGDSTYLKATIFPSTATDTTVTWTSSNPNVATIDSTGLLKSVTLGETIITATVSGKSVTIKVTVTNTEYNYGVAANFKRRVNVRATASGLGKLVGYAYVGDTFHILGKTGSWYYIQYNNTTKGYIWSSYLKASKTSAGYTSAGSSSGTTGGTTTPTGTPTKVTIANCVYAVNVRSAASTTSTRIGKASLGATYTYLGKEGDWYKIQYNTTTVGYVYSTFGSLS
ncbi:MAG TPA: Ig-like domain-containing protein [Candidatus Cryosericum sp.]|nr:Ig-like domain-containing protein [Candidatus Cryosericum sp.]